MIAGLVQILFFQGLGELLSALALPLIPGPVIGLFLLLAFLAVRRAIPEHVETVASMLVHRGRAGRERGSHRRGDRADPEVPGSGGPR
jgi:hypothetical protein